ncbi:sensor histidine kinase [Rhodohalobacter sp. 614A]|uniref:sensor histidine kinase n=1 Tax=Rhodohalobacter sp. 614A TaxID=2908649 RepID=UPI001F19FB82|nr:histidine kinase dimerization/phosphoacceptor domain -containing protein [Rhodohalobacter sp. 614A]
MTIKSRLNIVTILSVGSVIGLYLYLWYSTFQVDQHFEQIDQISDFTKTVSELNLVIDNYLEYREQRHLDSWNILFNRLTYYEKNIEDLSETNVISNSLSSIQSAFQLIEKIRQNPEAYPDIIDRYRLLERAESRIRSDIQMLLTISHNIASNRRETIREIQVSQQINFLMIMIPVVTLLGYLLYQLRTRIKNSLKELLEGTQQIAKGNLDLRVELQGNDEHKRLAENFNLMTQRLQEQINKEREAREKAEENQKRWEGLVEQDPNLVMIHIDGEIQFINPAGAQMMGASTPEELIGKSAYDFFLQSESQIKRKTDKPNKRNGINTPAIRKVYGLDKIERFVQIESVPIRYFGREASQTVGLDITDYIKYENELEKSIEEKTILLQEVHHRVKNNLAVTSGLLYMQRVSTDNPEIENLLGESERRIKTMTLIHELLYSSSDLSSIPMDEYIGNLVNLIQNSLDPEKNIDVTISSDSFAINVTQAVPCALILNELISNSYKHAFKNQETGLIDISVHQKNGDIEFAVRDNGIGIPDVFLREDGTSLGLTIVRTLIRQVEGTFEIKNDRGTAARFQFKKIESKPSGHST